MPIQHVVNDYRIPRGRVYFNPMDASGEYTGEIALGNCPGVTITIDTEKAEHFSSERGLAEKDDSRVIRVNRTGSITCDNFSPSNAALWLSGQHSKKSQAATPVTGEMVKVLQGRIYQLGQTTADPVGVRNVTAVTVKNEAGDVTYVAGEDYNVDSEVGRVQIIVGGDIADDATVQFGYTPVAGDFDAVQSGATAELTGALRVVADNAAGTNQDVFMPKVTLTPSGDFPIVAEGTEYVTMEFGLEVQKPANGEAIYVAGRPVAV